MQTYLQQHKGDVARIKECSEQEDANGKFVLQAGAFQATAGYYARMADHEAAARQRLGRDPKTLINTFCGQVAGPSAVDLATLLAELHDYLRLRPELKDVMFHVEQAAAEMKAAADREERRLEEDLDAPAAARSDDEYSRKVDSGLIGRGDFMPEAA